MRIDMAKRFQKVYKFAGQAIEQSPAGGIEATWPSKAAGWQERTKDLSLTRVRAQDAALPSYVQDPRPLTNTDVIRELSVRGTMVYDRAQFYPYNPDDLSYVRPQGSYPMQGLWAKHGPFAVYRRMRVDEQVKGCLTFKKIARLSHGYQVSPFTKGNILASEIADFIKYNFDNIESGFHSSMKEVLTALDFGFCLHGDTNIHTPQGDFAIKDLVGRTPWVYCWKDNALRLGQASKVWKTKENAKVIRVNYSWYSQGKKKSGSIVCTPEHPFLCLDGKYRKAGDLKSGDRLQPFSYTTKHMGQKKYKKARGFVKIGHGYGQSFWMKRSRWVWEQFNNQKVQKGDVIHHIDEDTMNDNPDNLSKMRNVDHASQHASEWMKNATPEQMEHRSSVAKETNKRSEVILARSLAATESNLKSWKNPIARANRINGMIGKEHSGGWNHSEETKAIMSEKSKERWNKIHELEANHKVVSIEDSGFADVYDMEVPEFHNFAANTVFVHNSVSEKNFKICDEGRFKGKIMLKGIKTRAPETFRFNNDEYGNIRNLTQFLPNATPIELPKDKFIIYTYADEFQNHYGQSDLRSAYRCFSDDTDILTETGWKPIKQVSLADRVATLNKETNELEYHYPSEVIHKRYTGKMLHQGGRFVDQLVTPNHRMWVKDANGKNCKDEKWHFVEAQNMPRLVRMKRDAKWTGIESKEFIIPQSLTAQGHIMPEIRIPMEAWLRLLGIWLAEGSLDKECYVNITQNPGKDCDTIIQWVKDAGFKPYIKGPYKNRNVCDIIISSKQLVSYFKQFGRSHDKFIPYDIKQLSPRLLRILIDAMMLGDGRHEKKDRFSGDYCTVSDRLADDMQEIIFKAGFASTKKFDDSSVRLGGGIWIIGVNSRRISDTFLNEHKDQRVWVDYDGDVHCVTVQNNLVYVRRNGKCVWSGNSWWSKDFVIKAWNIFLDKYGQPTRIMKLPNGSDGDLAISQKALAILESIQTDTSVTLPPGFQMEFMSVGQAGQAGYQEALDRYDRSIAKALLYPELGGLTERSSGGSQHMARSQMSGYDLVLMDLGLDIEEQVVACQIIRPLVEMNYGKDAPIPIFKLGAMTMRDVTTFVNDLSSAAKANLLTWGYSEESSLRKSMDLPDIEESDWQKAHSSEGDYAKVSNQPTSPGSNLPPLFGNRGGDGGSAVPAFNEKTKPITLSELLSGKKIQAEVGITKPTTGDANVPPEVNLPQEASGPTKQFAAETFSDKGSFIPRLLKAKDDWTVPPEVGTGQRKGKQRFQTTFSDRPKTRYEKRINFSQMKQEMNKIEEIGASGFVNIMAEYGKKAFDFVKAKKILDDKKNLKQIMDFQLPLRPLQNFFEVLLLGEYLNGKMTVVDELRKDKQPVPEKFAADGFWSSLWDAFAKIFEYSETDLDIEQGWGDYADSMTTDDLVKFFTVKGTKSGSMEIPLNSGELASVREKFKVKAFAIANENRGKVLSTVHKMTQKAVDEGWSYDTWKYNLDNKMKPLAGDVFGEDGDPDQAAHARTTFRTVMNETFNDGRLESMKSQDLGVRVIGVQYSAILDEATTDICRANDGAYMRIDNPNLVTPPAHFNAIKFGTLIDTINGKKPIEKISKGDIVLTHLGNYCRVYDVMSKKNDDFDHLLEIETESGSSVSLTPDHPILVCRDGLLRWMASGCIEVGDVLFEGGKKLGKASRSIKPSTRNSKNLPSLTGNNGISGNIMNLRSRLFMRFPINFNNKIDFRNNKISNEIFNNDLVLVENTQGIDDLHKSNLMSVSVESQMIGKLNDNLISDINVSDGIIDGHFSGSTGVSDVSFFRQSESPMLEVRSASDLLQSHAGSISLTSGFNSKLTTPMSNAVIGKPQSSLNTSERFSFNNMALLDHGIKDDGIVEFIDSNGLRNEFGHIGNYNVPTKVKLIKKAPYLGDVYNLAVEMDESYVASGLCVHNCRSIIVEVLEDDPDIEDIEWVDEWPMEFADGFGKDDFCCHTHKFAVETNDDGTLPMPCVIYTHRDDLDGLVSGILAQRLAFDLFGKVIPVKPISYQELPLVSHLDPAWFCDLGMSGHKATLNDRNVFFDHHQWEKMPSGKFFIEMDEEIATVGVLAGVILKYCPHVLMELEKLVQTINAGDIGAFNDETFDTARDLRFLFDMFGFEAMWYRFAERPNDMLIAKELPALRIKRMEADEEGYEQAVKSLIKTPWGGLVDYSGDGDRCVIMDRISKEYLGGEVAARVHKPKGSDLWIASFSSVKTGAALKVARSFGGGGHLDASGATLKNATSKESAIAEILGTADIAQSETVKFSALGIEVSPPTPECVVIAALSGSPETGMKILTGIRKLDPDAGMLSLPCGHVKDGESLQDAAARELEEETGIKVSANQLSWGGSWIVNGYGRENMFFVLLGGEPVATGNSDLENPQWQAVEVARDQEMSFDHSDLIDRARVLLGARSMKKKGIPNGFLIVFEGVDGSGKTTSTKNLVDWLDKKGYEVKQTKWNSSPDISEAIKSLKNEKRLNPEVFSAIHMADMMSRYNDEIKPALDEGKIVVCDRYIFTSLIRDSLRGVPMSAVNGVYDKVRRPDMLIHCVAPTEVAFARNAGAKDLKYYSSGMDLGLASSKGESCMKYIQMMHDSYCKLLPKQQGYLMLDTNKPIDELTQQVRTKFKSWIGKE